MLNDVTKISLPSQNEVNKKDSDSEELLDLLDEDGYHEKKIILLIIQKLIYLIVLYKMVNYIKLIHKKKNL